jgi:hypothetical protein
VQGFTLLHDKIDFRCGTGAPEEHIPWRV